jgi:hypothetical protein
MSAAPTDTFDAIALQLVAELEHYGSDTAAMIAAWPDMEGYRSVSERVEKIRLYSGALPQLRVQWLELLIAHAELVHVLWRSQYGDAATTSTELARVRESHADAVKALCARCRRALAQATQPSQQPASD